VILFLRLWLLVFLNLFIRQHEAASCDGHFDTAPLHYSYSATFLLVIDSELLPAVTEQPRGVNPRRVEVTIEAIKSGAAMVTSIHLHCITASQRPFCSSIAALAQIIVLAESPPMNGTAPSKLDVENKHMGERK